MRNEETTKHNRQITILTIILIFIGIIVLALAGVVIYNAINSKLEDNTEISEESCEETKSVFLCETGISENFPYEAETILDGKAENANLAIEYYDKIIAQAIKYRDYSWLFTILDAEDLLFKENNMPEAEFAALTRTDFSIADSPTYDYSKYHFASRIIELAKELGREDIVEQYEPLLAATKAEHDAFQQQIQKSSEEEKAKMEEARIADEKYEAEQKSQETANGTE